MSREMIRKITEIIPPERIQNATIYGVKLSSLTKEELISCMIFLSDKYQNLERKIR